MPNVIVASQSTSEFLSAKSLLKDNGVNAIHYSLNNFNEHEKIRHISIELSSLLEGDKIKDILFITDESSKIVLQVLDSKLALLSIQKGESLEKLLSKYVTSYHTYSLRSLSCRDDYQNLSTYKIGDHINFIQNPKNRIKRNPVFRKLNSINQYEKLLNYTLNNEGMFPKVWGLNIQKNYWNSTYNGGLPIVRKKDPVHEGTFMMHDIYHFLFTDPIYTYSNNPAEKKAYILHRMMSEAFTLVLADMLMIDHTNIEDEGYNTNKRKIYPLYKTLEKAHEMNELEKTFSILYANSKYAILGDDSGFIELGADTNELENYKRKYEIFFTADYDWNKTNIENMASDAANGREFYIHINQETNKFNTSNLVNDISDPFGRLDFDKLFMVFWERYIHMLSYNEEFDKKKYASSGISKYLTGQLKILFDYGDKIKSKDILLKAKTFLRKLKDMDISSMHEGYLNINSELHRYIERLVKDDIILSHQEQLYKLHYPHFPAEYLSYDKPKSTYIPLEKQKDIIIGKDLSNKTRSIKKALELIQL